jgi:hypothetical protein
MESGLVSFYSTAGWTGVTGIAYHIQGGQNGPAVPTGYGASGEFQLTTTLAAIQDEIDNNRTVIACFLDWNLQSPIMGSAPTHSGHEIDYLTYYQLGPTINSSVNPLLEETYNHQTDENGIGHAALIVGYIPAGGADDIEAPSNPTNWLIVRDNDDTTVRNVAIPFDQYFGGASFGWDKLVATLYTNLSVGSWVDPASVCTPTVTATPI